MPYTIWYGAFCLPDLASVNVLKNELVPTWAKLTGLIFPRIWGIPSEVKNDLVGLSLIFE
jgi:hypothetical protein